MKFLDLHRAKRALEDAGGSCDQFLVAPGGLRELYRDITGKDEYAGQVMKIDNIHILEDPRVPPGQIVSYSESES